VLKVAGVPQDFLIVFAITWCVAVAYVVTLLSALTRVRRLERPGTPYGLAEILAAPPTLEMLGLLFGQRHRALDDALASRLVWAARTLFGIALPLILYVFWRAFALAIV
jgi:hypothetical protein